MDARAVTDILRCRFELDGADEEEGVEEFKRRKPVRAKSNGASSHASSALGGGGCNDDALVDTSAAPPWLGRHSVSPASARIARA